MSDYQPKWRKVLVSGSNLHGAGITASSVIETDNTQSPRVEERVLVYNTQSGAFYYTGSYGAGGSGGGTPATPLNSVQYNNNSAFGGDAGFVFDDTQDASLLVDGPITASGDISSSNNLFISTSLSSSHTNNNVLLINTATGEIYHTGSYGSGGGTTPTLQQVMDEGSITSTAITASADISSSAGISASTATIIKDEDGGDVTLTVRNSNTDGGLDKNAGIVFGHAIGSNAGKILAGKDGIYQGAAETADSNLKFFTAEDGNDIERLRISSNGNISASGDLFISTITASVVSSSDTGSFPALNGIVDTQGASTNDILVFDGSKFVAVPDGTSFNFAINSFNYTGPTGNILIGSSSRVVFSAGTLDFTAAYNAGPPNYASASITNDSDAGDPVIFTFSMDSPNFTTGDNPSDITQGDLAVTINEQIDFELTASKGGTELYSEIQQNIRFYNHMKFGASTSTTYNSTLIASLSGQVLNSSYFGSTARSVSVGASNYLYLALRTAASQPAQVYCGTGANKLTVAMNSTITNKTPEIRSTITPYANVNGYSEAFYIYRSQNTNLSAHSSTFEFQSSGQVKNYFFWGRNASAGQETEAGVEALENKNSTYDDGTITDPTTLTVGTLSAQYIYIAIPSRYGVNGTNYQLKDNGTNLPLAVNDAVNVDITNPVGFQEEYKVYRTENQLTQATTFTVKIDSV